MDPAASFCPDKADRHQDLAQELTGRPRRFISGPRKEKKETFMFYYKKRGGRNDGRQIAFFVGGKRDTKRRQMMIFNAERQKANRQASLPLQPHFEDEFLRE